MPQDDPARCQHCQEKVPAGGQCPSCGRTGGLVSDSNAEKQSASEGRIFDLSSIPPAQRDQIESECAEMLRALDVRHGRAGLSGLLAALLAAAIIFAICFGLAQLWGVPFCGVGLILSIVGGVFVTCVVFAVVLTIKVDFAVKATAKDYLRMFEGRQDAANSVLATITKPELVAKYLRERLGVEPVELADTTEVVPMDRKKIERECRKLLAELDVVFRKAKAKGRIAALIIGAIFLIGGIVWIGLVGMNLQTDKIFFGAVVGTMIVFAAYGIAFELVSKPAIKTAAEAYREKFKDHRDTADEVLELIGQPRDAIDDLCRELKIKTPEQLRHQREKKKRAHAREIARGTAKSPYACGGCGAKVLVEAGGRGILWCRKCKRWLEMPKTISCPVCKSKRVGYASTESQHEPSDKGKGAGALMGGLPGVLAGAALDVVRNEIAMELNQAFAKPKFRCTSCGHLFLVKLVVK